MGGNVLSNCGNYFYYTSFCAQWCSTDLPTSGMPEPKPGCTFLVTAKMVTENQPGFTVQTSLFFNAMKETTSILSSDYRRRPSVGQPVASRPQSRTEGSGSSHMPQTGAKSNVGSRVASRRPHHTSLPVYDVQSIHL